MPEAPDRRFHLAAIARYTGQVVPARLLQRTSEVIPGIDRFHHLIRGIFKPAWSVYPLSIAVVTDSPYAARDEVVFLDDGRWLATYAPFSGGANAADNQAMHAAMNDRVPIAMFRQQSIKTSPQGSTYLVLGLALLTGYNPQQQTYTVEAAPEDVLFQTAKIFSDEVQQQEVVLYAQLSNEFVAIAAEDPATYLVTREKRSAAFRRIVLAQYDFSCAACELRFHLDDQVHEATAAHIMPKNLQGTDDPRNGLSLCRSHHWAFDEGLFTVTPDLRIQVSPVAGRARVQNFAMQELECKPLLLPRQLALRPHEEALKWHRETRYLSM